jgi:hypothetical protein
MLPANGTSAAKYLRYFFRRAKTADDIDSSRKSVRISNWADKIPIWGCLTLL